MAVKMLGDRLRHSLDAGRWMNCWTFGTNTTPVRRGSPAPAATHFPTPTALCPLAQGCRAAATLGNGIHETFYANGVASHSGNSWNWMRFACCCAATQGH
ncbi:MAG: hypothetical protein WCJ35_09540 [Planctomycetota bacterium]